jgi:acyl-CoA thioester hydrolase
MSNPRRTIQIDYKHQHLVQFYETDMMGIVHHGNYLLFFEEARVGWAHAHGLLDYQKPESASHFAVLETWVRHLKPAKFGDVLEVFVQAKLEGVRLTFEYKMIKRMTTPSAEEVIAIGRTIHAPLNKDLQVIRPSIEMRQLFKEIAEKKIWIETWLSNL